MSEPKQTEDAPHRGFAPWDRASQSEQEDEAIHIWGDSSHGIRANLDRRVSMQGPPGYHSLLRSRRTCCTFLIQIG